MTTEATAPETPTKTTFPRWLAPAGIGAVALVAGLAIGASTGSANAACVDALDAADEVVGVFATVMFDVADGLDAIAAYDAGGIYAMSSKIDAHSATIQDLTPVYTEASAECRGA